MDGASELVEDVGVDHGGFEAFVAEEFLDDADVVALDEEVGGEGVAEGVAGDAGVEAGELGGDGDGFLEDGFVEMVAAELVGFEVQVVAVGGEEPLPGPGLAGGGGFSVEGEWEFYPAGTALEILLVLFSYLLDVGSEGSVEGGGQDGETVLAAFAVTNGDLSGFEVEVFDAELEAFEEAKTRAVEQGSGEVFFSLELGEDGGDFGNGEDIWDALGTLGPNDGVEPGKIHLKDFSVEVEDGRECLVLG